MGDGSFTYLGLLIIAIAAVVAPMLSELVPGGVVPPVVLEVVAGIILGPQVLGWVTVNVPVEVLSLMGLGFLLFLAGMELTPRSLVDRPARIGGIAYVVAVAVSFPVAIALRALGAGADIRLLALALTSTSLGVLVPVLRDAGESESRFGQTVLVNGSIGEFASLLLLTVMFSADPKSTPVQILYVAGMGVSAVVATLVVRWWWGSRWFSDSLDRLDETTSQLRVRSAFVLLLLFATLVDGFGLSAVLGAFVAGIVLHSANRNAPAPVQERYVAKLNAVGFGFVIPVFFITTGAQLDIRDVVRNGHTLALVPLFLVGMILSRGVTSGLVLRHGTTVRGAVALGSFQATSLTFPIIVTAIGIDLHFMTRSTAAALVTAGLLSVMLLPALALAIRPWDDDAVAAADRSDQARPGG